MAKIVRVWERNRWMYLNIDQVVSVSNQSPNVWVMTIGVDEYSTLFVNDEHCQAILTAMGHWGSRQRHSVPAMTTQQQ